MEGRVSIARCNIPQQEHREIYSASPSHRRECSYYIAVGYYKLRNYANAKKFNGACGTCAPAGGSR
jgi:hypothetical protein